jgi:catechol 2,3-dioxygenase-like lactoylglutathione lyase family enzyme
MRSCSLLLSGLAAFVLGGCAVPRAGEPPQRAQLVTEIAVRDLKKSVAFYRALGFRTAFTEATFAELQWRDGHKLFLSEQKGRAPIATPAANLRIGVAKVDEAWAVARRMGAKVITPLGDRFYHERDFLIVDTDGFGLRFASLLPGGKW